MGAKQKAVVRQFKTGANRDVDTNKLNYTGFLNPFVIKRFADYMHKNRTLADGSLRAADNWQKGIPRQAYMESLERHFMEIKLAHQHELDALRGQEAPRGTGDTIRTPDAMIEALMAIIFNAQGMALELMKGTEIEEAA